MRWFKHLLKGLSFSTMAASAVVLAAGVGCGDESFTFCECKYSCTANFPDPADPTGMTMGSTMTELTVCDDGDGGFTYGDCGVFCKSTLPATLPTLETMPLGACPLEPGGAINCYDPVPGVLGPPTVATLTGCSTTPVQTLAKNSCSVGTPVGE